ncbi:ribonucleoside-diphosphate reductase subunit alpha [Candidatus Liberibacter americanus]|uniref:Ribonucleoside-diphosphate reductase n=1 Tax=Candidatus Liberibacter americanus str. Sao Paulo TaxID=1261131 RepID=U6B3Z2_9HYPH|nr:ribonucleoside-diphosphate reductase subunit alpha [Candidatus Liberibacter americanus]AHA27774.1 Ribonucleotide reductase alpha subunit [Candidatus Liberibacter americanus str. Sao Paulo]EMS36159.1 ribonucleotide-diphosphate reductase subunit alpha [Candidatus Liberibacter americanus PW_SP]
MISNDDDKSKNEIFSLFLDDSFPPEISSFRVIRRNGTVTPFDPLKIGLAIMKAFVAVEGKGAAVSSRVKSIIRDLTKQTVARLLRHYSSNSIVHIEAIQDQVELSLMRSDHLKIARAYVLYRKKRSDIRTGMHENSDASLSLNLKIKMDDGTISVFDSSRLESIVTEACEGLNDVSSKEVLNAIYKDLYEGISESEIELASIMASRVLIEKEPNYAKVSARLLLDKLRREALTAVCGIAKKATHHEMKLIYKDYFVDYIKKGINSDLLHPSMEQFNLVKLANAICPERDLFFDYLGLQTLYDRYFLHTEGCRFEMPQAFFMRVAMGLSLNEAEKEKRAIEFYDLLSSFYFMCSTPTLFNAGTNRPQLSSCFLTTVPDDLDGIFESIKENALLAKYSGGIGNDWTQVRALGAHIHGTNGKSQGLVPFLKVANDTAVAVNQGGKRKGAVCAYLETWHIDIEEFLDLRKNTGDDRRRTHDMNTANWVPDLFMKRVENNENWTLFSPDEVNNLHSLYGLPFEKAYVDYEKKAEQGEIKIFRKIPAVTLWRKMITMLYETGHPWITFKDPCNIRSPQQHVGVVHSSNLCTEITLNTSKDEVAVCNLGSLNLVAHLDAKGKLNYDKLKQTISTAVRMLDNVIDLNWYTIDKTKNANYKHRPIGLGLMGFQSILQEMRIPYASEEAVIFADQSMEFISYQAISASANLAEERNKYPSFEGSLWSKGILPIDSIKILEECRYELEMDRSYNLDWESLRKRIMKVGMRNSNCMAIAPTATIANICGVSQSIEPSYQNLFVKSNMSGDFTVVNSILVNDLKKIDLWDEAMISDLKYYDGSIGNIELIPEDLKKLHATAFEIDPIWLIEAASRRQKWIDQSQSLNLYIAEPSGKKIDFIYRQCWIKGLKTTYYLRSRSATHVEKSTLKEVDGKLNAVPVMENNPSSDIPKNTAFTCGDNESACEVCQ